MGFPWNLLERSSSALLLFPSIAMRKQFRCRRRDVRRQEASDVTWRVTSALILQAPALLRHVTAALFQGQRERWSRNLLSNFVISEMVRFRWSHLKVEINFSFWSINLKWQRLLCWCEICPRSSVLKACHCFVISVKFSHVVVVVVVWRSCVHHFYLKLLYFQPRAVTWLVNRSRLLQRNCHKVKL